MDASSTPCTTDYLALISVTGLNPPATVPSGWTLLLSRSDTTVGMQANAFFNNQTHQIVIAFYGPTSSPGGGFVIGNGASETDGMILAGDSQGLQALTNAVNAFVNQVKVAAAAQDPPLSTDSNNIFVAGSSLGGYEAELVAQENGFGGANFGGP